MTMTIELLAERVTVLEKQVAMLLSNDKKKGKKNKKAAAAGDDDKPKKKRLSGYLLYINAHRDEAKSKLESKLKGDDKVKTTDVTKKLAEMWKAQKESVREEWNTKAKKMKEEEEA
jgi:hypothetical protein